MTNDDKRDFYLTMDGIAEVFNIELSTMRKRAYFVALADLPWQAIREACQKAIRVEKFFPVPATLRELAGFPTDKRDPAEAAWHRLRNAHDRYNRAALSDPLTRQVFEAMGGGYALEWGFGNWPLEQEDRKRREFISRYHETQNANALVMTQERAHA
jgi:hypothetical protein